MPLLTIPTERTIEDSKKPDGGADRPTKFAVVSAVYNTKGQLLMGRRRDSGKWVCPGGGLNEGESPQHGAVRELYEEAGVVPDDIQFLGDGLVENGTVRVSCFKMKSDDVPTGLQDPDQECSLWEWVDVVDGLPSEIRDNLKYDNDVALRYIGLQRGSIKDDRLDGAKVSATNLIDKDVVGKSEDLGKMAHPGPLFPKLGVKDRNRHPVPIITDRTQAEIHHRAIINAAIRNNHLGGAGRVDIPGLQIPPTTPRGDRANMGWRIMATQPGLPQNIRESQVQAMGAGGGVNGISSSIPGNVSAYAKGNPMRGPYGRSTNGPMATQLHENLHQVFKQVQEKYGMQGRKNLAANMLNELEKQNPKGHMALTKYITNARPEYGIYNPRRPEQADEEHFTHLLNFLNNPVERNQFKSQFHLDDQHARQHHQWMKGAYHTLNHIAQNADSTMVLAPSHRTILNMKKSEDLLKGSLQVRLPYKPQRDTTDEERYRIKEWQHFASPEDREQIPRLEGNGRVRALMGLHGKTETRRNPDTGGREFLLHRAISPTDDLNNITSWTTNKDIANSFGRHGRIVESVWTPEHKIHHVLRQAGYVDDFSTMRMHGVTPKPGISVKTPSGAIRGMGKPGYEEDEVLVSKSEVIYRDMELEKSAKGALLGAALAFASAPTQAHEVPSVQWTAQNLHRELLPIAKLESSNGKNIHHAANSKGEFNTAYGALGFKPIVAHEDYTKSPKLQAKFPNLHDPNAFMKRFTQDPNFYNEVANHHWLTLKNMFSQDSRRAAHAWRHGPGATMKAKDIDVLSDPYVSAYQNIADPLRSISGDHITMKSSDHAPWRSREITIPNKHSPVRIEYERAYAEMVRDTFGQNNLIKSISISESQINQDWESLAPNEDRFNLYYRMLVGGDSVPPIVVKRIGEQYFIVDGHHRLAATKAAKKDKIRAFEIVDG